jgi:hypothetical protein
MVTVEAKMRRFLIAFLLVPALGQAQSIKYTPAGAGGITGLSSDGSVITSTLPLLLPDGSNSAPSYSFSSETNSGLYRVGSYNFGFAFGGSRRLVLTASVFGMDVSHAFGWYSAGFAAHDLILSRESAAVLQLGVDVNGAAIAQTLKSHDGITGTDVAGANFTLAGGRGTGAGTPGKIILQTATTLGTGTTAQTLATRLTISEAGLLLAAITQANLGTPANGTIAYCSDCTIANPCAGGGTGALAKRLNGVWVCN